MTQQTAVSPQLQALPVDVAIISPQLTPYRLHYHRRIVAELPEIHLHSVFTHEAGDNAFAMKLPPDINPVLFGAGESAKNQDKLRYFRHEWRRGGLIIQWLRTNNVRAVVLIGYNDAGRMRIIRWCRRHGVAVFLWGDSNIRGDFASGIKAVIKRALVGWVIKSSTGVMPCGTLGEQYFLKYGAKPEQIFFAPYEPDYDLIQSLPQSEIDAVKLKYGLREGRRRMVFSGRMIEAKRPDLILDAFISIAEQRPEWDLLMAGDGPLREDLMRKVPSNLASRIIWTGFINNQAQVSALYRNADVMVLPSSYEPWALVINEAAAAGLAIVSSDVVGASAELVRDDVNGYLFTNNDLRSLIEKLLAATVGTNADKMKANSSAVLQLWRDRADPVNGLRRALQFAKLLPT